MAGECQHEINRAQGHLTLKESECLTKIVNNDKNNSLLPPEDPVQPNREAGEIVSHIEPLVLVDAFITSDAGQLLMVQYVDIGASSLDWQRVVLVKGIESVYSLAHSTSIRISSPHRFRDLGETMIRDEQEGRAESRTEERNKKEYVAERREQEDALRQLGVDNIHLGSQDSWNTSHHSDSYTFGEGSWIFCTALQPTCEDEWKRLRNKLPPTYDDFTTIHQPRRFAQALGLMFMDQVGPNSTDGRFSHNSKGTKSIVSLHDSLKLMHGPVLYTENVYDFLNTHQNSALAKFYPLFVKSIEHQDQREYRFVIVGNDDFQSETRDIAVSGMMRDSQMPVRKTSSVRFEASAQDEGKDEEVTGRPKGYTKRKDMTRSKSERRTRVVSVDGRERQREEQTREVVLSVASESVVRGDAADELAEEEERHTGRMTERRSYSIEVDGVPVESSNSEIVHIGYIANVDDTDDVFSVDEKREAEEVIQRVREIGQGVLNWQKLRKTISQMLEVTLESDKTKSVEMSSAALHGICALLSLNQNFGDVVESVGIEKERFVTVGLKPGSKSNARGKLLVGPLGTYAYLLQKGDEATDGVGGEEWGLMLFPSEEDAERFAEFGWPVKESAGEVR